MDIQNLALWGSTINSGSHFKFEENIMCSHRKLYPKEEVKDCQLRHCSDVGVWTLGRCMNWILWIRPPDIQGNYHLVRYDIQGNYF